MILSVTLLVTVFLLKSWIDPRLKGTFAKADRNELEKLVSLYDEYEVISLIPGYSGSRTDSESDEGYFDLDSEYDRGYRQGYRRGRYGGTSADSDSSGGGRVIGLIILLLIPFVGVLTAIALQRSSTRNHSSEMAYHLEKKYDA